MAATDTTYATAPGYAARHLVSLRTVRRWIANGLPAHHVGSRCLRIPIERADAFLEAGHIHRVNTHPKKAEP